MRKLRDLCVNSTDFDIVKVISRGRFAEVSVVKEKVTQNVYVMKKLRKADVLNTQDVCFKRMFTNSLNPMFYSVFYLVNLDTFRQ